MNVTQLIEMFSDHELKCEADMKKAREDFAKNYPDEKLPEWMEASFSLPGALKDICVEISIIKQKLGLE